MKEIAQQVNEIFDKFNAVILLYNCQSYAIWKDENAFYMLNSEDTDKEGRLVERASASCCVTRSKSLPTIVDYLTSNFRISKQLYEIFSFRIDSKVTLEDALQKIQPKKKKSQIIQQNNEVLIETQNFAPITEEKCGLSAILFRHQAEPTFGDNYQSSSLPQHNFLTCDNYLSPDGKNQAPFIASVAIVMLKICKSSLWMSSTIENIFQIGTALYVDNVEKVLIKREMERLERLELIESLEYEFDVGDDDDEDENEHEREGGGKSERDEIEEEKKQLTPAEIRELRREKKKKPLKEFHPRQEIPITEIRPICSIGKFKFEVSVENIIIGKVLSRNLNELSLEAGIEHLFKHHDYGLILGHDVVAVWREQNHYFLFDPNQCDQFKRVAFDDDFAILNSCLSCFKNPADLVKLYIDNLPKDKRNSTFKICKVETFDYVEKPNDWYNFKGIGSDKWILCGHICESSDEFNLMNKNHQSTCISLTALAKTRELGVLSWTQNTIDEVIRLGDEFHSGCVIKLKELKKFESPNLTLNEAGRELKLDKIVVDFAFEEAIVVGELQQDGSSFVSLGDGLKMFFENDDLAVVTACGISMAVFKYLDAFYLFDSHARDDMGRNFKTIGENFINFYGFQFYF